MFVNSATDLLLDELNVEQRAAATYSGETLLILAGAGTGKTTTLCSRAAWLMAQGTPAERILLLTFTRTGGRGDGRAGAHARSSGWPPMRAGSSVARFTRSLIA